VVATFGSQDEIDIRLLLREVNMHGLKKLAEKHHLLPKLTSLQTKIRKLK